jgi:hypothetical protein
VSQTLHLISQGICSEDAASAATAARAPSPPPAHAASAAHTGKVRAAGLPERLSERRDTIIEELVLRCPGYRAPADWRPPQKTARLEVPQKEHPEIDFVARVLGPRGRTQKEMEAKSGAKIVVRSVRCACCVLRVLCASRPAKRSAVRALYSRTVLAGVPRDGGNSGADDAGLMLWRRGGGSAKNGGALRPGALTGRDAVASSAEEPLHVLITADTQRALDAAAALVRPLLQPQHGAQHEYGSHQLHKSAIHHGKGTSGAATSAAAAPAETPNAKRLSVPLAEAAARDGAAQQAQRAAAPLCQGDAERAHGAHGAAGAHASRGVAAGVL